MPSAQRRFDQGSRLARQLAQRLGEELREGRIAAGLSQAQVGAAARLSAAQVSRLERGLVANASLLSYARCLAVVGLRLSAKAYPDAPPLRDAAHARLLLRLKAQLPSGVGMRLEVPIRAHPLDQRAWDAEIVLAKGSVKVEAETRLRDAQALERRIGLKIDDNRTSIVILLVAETRSNAAILKEFRALFRGRFPLDTRSVLHALRNGDAPTAGGICVL
jgi:transcriptional regulator with XRE-family HTH domain